MLVRARWNGRGTVRVRDIDRLVLSMVYIRIHFLFNIIIVYSGVQFSYFLSIFKMQPFSSIAGVQCLKDPFCSLDSGPHCAVCHLHVRHTYGLLIQCDVIGISCARQHKLNSKSATSRVAPSRSSRFKEMPVGQGVYSPLQQSGAHPQALRAPPHP